MRHLAAPLIMTCAALAALGAGSASWGQQPSAPASGPRWIWSSEEPSQRRIEFELLGRPARAPSRALAAAVARHPGLPQADVVAALASTGSQSLAKGSFELSPLPGERCAVHIALDELGHGTIARDLYAAAEAAGGDVDPARLDRMNEMETLHELGHCVDGALDMGFMHPGLSPEQNRALTEILSTSPGLGGLRTEMFADVFSALICLRDAKGARGREAASLDVRTLRDWRASDANGEQAEMHPDGQSGRPRPTIFGNEHATAPALDEMQSELARYMAMDPARAAAEASSRALLRVAMQAADGPAEAAKALDPGKLAVDAVADLMQEIWLRQRDLLAGRAAKAKRRIEADAPAYAKSTFESGGSTGRALATLSEAIGRASIARAPSWVALPDSDAARPPRYGSAASADAEQAAKAALADAGPAAELMARFGAGPELFESARSGWASALEQERARLGERAAAPVWDPLASAKLSTDLFPDGPPAKRRQDRPEFTPIPTKAGQGRTWPEAPDA